MGLSELGGWWIDYIIFKDLETASSGHFYLFLLCTFYFLQIIDGVLVEDSCGFMALPSVLWNGILNNIFRNYYFLEQGSVLVLEPQPWKSYENNRLVFEVIIFFFASLNDSYFMDVQLIKCLVNMVLKTSMVKKLKKGVITSFVVRSESGWWSNRWCYKYLINNYKIIKIVNKIYNKTITYNIVLKIYIYITYFKNYYVSFYLLHVENKNNQI